jgi:GNAT superfamily N-acetyltransferase
MLSAPQLALSGSSAPEGQAGSLFELAGVHPIVEWKTSAGYVVSTDPDRLDLRFIHAFLATAYWSRGVPRVTVERSIANSLPFGLYAPRGEQAGFARAVTDYAAYAYLGDVFVTADHRGQGLGKFLVSCVLSHPELQGLRRWALATGDAHALYRQFGFGPPAQPDIHMFIERSPAELWPPSSERPSPVTDEAT